MFFFVNHEMVDEMMELEVRVNRRKNSTKSKKK